MFPEHHLMLHFSPQFVDFEIVSGEVSSKTTFLRVMGTDRKSKHLCCLQWELGPRTMFIEIRAVTRVLRRAHSALPLYVTSLLIADISDSDPSIADWSGLTEGPTSKIGFDTVQMRGSLISSDIALPHHWAAKSSILWNVEQIAKYWRLTGRPALEHP